MNETDDCFRSLVEAEAPDLWPEIERRATEARSPAGLREPRASRRTVLAALTGVALLALGAIAGSQVGEDQDHVEAATVPSQSPATATPETSTTDLKQTGADVDFSMLLAGPAPGIFDQFVSFDDMDEFLNATSLTAVARFVDYELNPAAASPDIYVPGYAGPHGVMRLYFVIEDVAGGSDATILRAPGRSGGNLVAVDVEYWIGPDAQPEHLAALDGLKERPERFVLFLTAGMIDQARTGAYKVWNVPIGSFVEHEVGGQLRLLLPDNELVAREAVERGLNATTTTSSSLEHGSEDPEFADSPNGLSVDPVEEVVGLTVEEFLAEYQQSPEARPTW